MLTEISNQSVKTISSKLMKIYFIYFLFFRGYFLIDCIATIPGLYTGESIDYYWLKMFRIFHIHRLTQPQQLVLEFMLQNLSKKRQGDLTVFAGLILGVVYTNHINACFWLYLGHQIDCSKIENPGDRCLSSWIYVGEPPDRFADKPEHTQYIFAFYWIFEVITTVGYGDYTGMTSEELLFSIALQFIGLVFFSFLMGSINGIFNTSDNFEDLIDEKLDQLDMWIKKIEKSNKPFHI